MELIVNFIIKTYQSGHRVRQTSFMRQHSHHHLAGDAGTVFIRVLPLQVAEMNEKRTTQSTDCSLSAKPHNPSNRTCWNSCQWMWDMFRGPNSIILTCVRGMCPTRSWSMLSCYQYVRFKSYFQHIYSNAMQHTICSFNSDPTNTQQRRANWFITNSRTRRTCLICPAKRFAAHLGAARQRSMEVDLNCEFALASGEYCQQQQKTNCPLWYLRVYVCYWKMAKRVFLSPICTGKHNNDGLFASNDVENTFWHALSVGWSLISASLHIEYMQKMSYFFLYQTTINPGNKIHSSLVKNIMKISQLIAQIKLISCAWIS